VWKWGGTKSGGLGDSRGAKGAKVKRQGAKAPRSDLAREQIGQGPIGRFAPESKLGRERKGSVPIAAVFDNEALSLSDSFFGIMLLASTDSHRSANFPYNTKQQMLL